MAGEEYGGDMFELNLEAFCDGCPHIEPEAVKDVFWAGDEPAEVKVQLTCLHISRCRRLKRRFTKDGAGGR